MNAPQYIIDNTGNPTGVILGVATYLEMIDLIEELEDIRDGEAVLDDGQAQLPFDVVLARLEQREQAAAMQSPAKRMQGRLQSFASTSKTG